MNLWTSDLEAKVKSMEMVCTEHRLSSCGYSVAQVVSTTDITLAYIDLSSLVVFVSNENIILSW